MQNSDRSYSIKDFLIFNFKKKILYTGHLQNLYSIVVFQLFFQKNESPSYSVNPFAINLTRGESNSPRFLQFLRTAVHARISFVASFYLLYFLSLSMSWHPIQAWEYKSIERESKEARRRQKRDNYMNCCSLKQ